MLSHKLDWRQLSIASDQTHHLMNGVPAYPNRFLQVLKFHDPGVAPVEDEMGAYHIDTAGNPIYQEKYLRTFGFYEGKAAVTSKEGCFHLNLCGSPLYSERYEWVGNYQEQFCSVRDRQGSYYHIDNEGKKAYPFSFSYAGDFRDNCAVIQNELGMSTHINRKGEFLHHKWFDDLDVFHKGFARAKDKMGWFHITSNGCELYHFRYANIEPFYNGFARVESLDGSIAIINELGIVAHQLRPAQQDNFHQASAKLVSYWELCTLDCACNIMLFDQFPSSPSTLAEKTGYPIESIERLLTALLGMGLAHRLDNNQYALTEVGMFFTTNHPESLARASQFWKAEHHESWEDLQYSLKTGKSAFEKKYGMNWFTWIRQNPEKNTLFHDTMDTYARHDYKTIPNCLDMSLHSIVIDIGGSTGILLKQLLYHYPHLKGMLLDLPETVVNYPIDHSLENRMELIGQDFFQPWPQLRGDAIFLSRILHDWSDLEALVILKKAAECLTASTHSKIYIVENLLNPNTGFGGLLDLNMLVMTSGKERTLEQYQELITKAQLRLEKTVALNEVSSILVVNHPNC